MVAKQDDEFKEWVLPSFEDEQQQDGQETDLFGKPANWYNSKNPSKVEEEEDKPKPLTLEDIEAIRASAYEDGFNEGKEAGFSKGLEEGKLQGLKEGHEQGLQQGVEEGLQQGQVKIEAQMLHWQQLVSRLNRPLEKLDDSVEFQLVKLATTLAEQICRCEVTVNSQVVLQALKQAVDALPANELSLVISFHPDDLEFVQIAFSVDECEKRGWDLRAEPSLQRGDCQVHTQTSSIDYTFSSRIDQVLKHFLRENYQHAPEVSNDVDISNDQALDYEMQSEQDIINAQQAELEVVEEKVEPAQQEENASDTQTLTSQESVTTGEGT